MLRKPSLHCLHYCLVLFIFHFTTFHRFFMGFRSYEFAGKSSSVISAYFTLCLISLRTEQQSGSFLSILLLGCFWRCLCFRSGLSSPSQIIEQALLHNPNKASVIPVMYVLHLYLAFTFHLTFSTLITALCKQQADLALSFWELLYLWKGSCQVSNHLHDCRLLYGHKITFQFSLFI